MTHTTTETMLLEALEKIAKETEVVMIYDEDTGFEKHHVPTAPARIARRAIATAKGEGQ